MSATRGLRVGRMKAACRPQEDRMWREPACKSSCLCVPVFMQVHEDEDEDEAHGMRSQSVEQDQRVHIALLWSSSILTADCCGLPHTESTVSVPQDDRLRDYHVVYRTGGCARFSGPPSIF
eukprot:355524-Chlamydomonas_euryale.AAC.5